MRVRKSPLLPQPYLGVSKECIMISMLYAESSPSRKTTMRRALVVATALLLGVPATSAFAHDPGDYQGIFNHFTIT